MADFPKARALDDFDPSFIRDPVKGLYLPNSAIGDQMYAALKGGNTGEVREVVKALTEKDPKVADQLVKKLDRTLGALFDRYHALMQTAPTYGGAISSKPRYTPSFNLIRTAFRQSLIDQLCVGAREAQIKLVFKRVLSPGRQKGWTVKHIRHADPYFRASKNDLERIAQVEQMLEHPSREVHPGGFRDVLVKMVRGELIIDRNVLLPRRDMRGKPGDWYMLPGDQILPIFPVLLKTMYRHNLQKLDEAVRHVQTIDGIDLTGMKYCFKHNTKIETDQGFMCISKIVNQRLPVKVKSVDLDTGRVFWAPVTNWFKRPVTEWISLYYSNNRSLWVTPDHLIWSDNGWVKAEVLRGGETVYVAATSPNAEQEQLILGSALGDDSILKPSKNGNCRFSASHSEKQRDYVQWKADSLAVPKLRPQKMVRFDKPHTSLTASTFANPALNQYRDLCYPDGKKHISKEWLDRIEPLGLAVWIMDDGSIATKGDIYVSLRIGLSAAADEREVVTQFFQSKWSMEPTWSHAETCKDGRPFYQLCFSADDTRRLLAALSDYITFDRDVCPHKKWIAKTLDSSGIDTVVPVKLTKVERKAVSHRRLAHAYDITVPPTHVILANSLTVHQCQELDDGHIVGAWRDGEIAVNITNPSDELNSYGFGISMFEKSLEATTLWLYIIHYMKGQFLSSYPEAFLIINGEVNPQGLQQFKNMIYAQVGAEGNTRLPILATGDQENKVQLLRLRDTVVDMSLVSILRLIMALKCAAYRLNPSTINVASDQGDKGPIIQPGADQAEIIGSLQEEGFKGLCESFSDFITRELIQPWYDDLILHWEVEDIPPESDRIVMWTQKLSLGATMDEWRASENLPPLEEVTDGQYSGKVPGNPFVFQDVQLRMAMEQQAQQTEQEQLRADDSNFTGSGGKSQKKTTGDKKSTSAKGKTKSDSGKAAKGTKKTKPKNTKKLKKSLLFWFSKNAT